MGLGSTGGFQYVLEALQGQSATDVAAVMRALTVAANQQPQLAGVFTTYAANTPQIYLDIDRDKAQMLGVKIGDMFNALQSMLGSFYVNDFNVFGRTWQVNMQADAPFRDQIERHRSASTCATPRATMVPMRAFADAQVVLGPQTVMRYNGFRGVTIIGAPKPPAKARAQRSRRWSALGRDAAARLRLRVDRRRRCRKRPRAARRGIISLSRCCSLICSWSGSTRAGTSRSRRCSR